MNIAICDDQQAFLDCEKQTVERYFAEWTEPVRISTFSNGTSFLHALEHNQFDIIFLDIDLPDLNGFEIAEKFPCSNNTLLVFVSSYEDLAIQSFDYHPFSFISKMEYNEQIGKVLNSCTERLRRSIETITITCNRELVKLNIQDIAYIESCRNAVLFHMQNSQETFKTTATMSKFEQELSVHGFVRIHSAFIVNLAAVRKIAKEVTLDDGTALFMSKKYASTVKIQYLDYMRRLP